MANQLRVYSPNNLRRNLAGPQYPDRIVLRGRDLEFFVNISPLIETLDDLNNRQNELVLEREWIHGGDPYFWTILVDLLFPYELPERHMPSHELFLFRPDGSAYLNPHRPVSMNDLKEVVDYFMIGRARDLPQVLARFAYMRPGAPERPTVREIVAQNEHNLRRRLAEARRLRNTEDRFNVPPNNNNRYFNNNNNENENEEPELGYTEEEEEMLGRLQGANVGRYYRGGQKTRRNKKLNRKTRKQ